MGQLKQYDKIIGGTVGTAEEVGYDNSTSGLTATNTQAAIDEINSDLSELGDKVLAEVTADGNKTYATIFNELYTQMLEAETEDLMNLRLLKTAYVESTQQTTIEEMQFVSGRKGWLFSFQTTYIGGSASTYVQYYILAPTVAGSHGYELVRTSNGTATQTTIDSNKPSAGQVFSVRSR